MILYMSEDKSNLRFKFCNNTHIYVYIQYMKLVMGCYRDIDWAKDIIKFDVRLNQIGSICSIKVKLLMVYNFFISCKHY